MLHLRLQHLPCWPGHRASRPFKEWTAELPINYLNTRAWSQLSTQSADKLAAQRMVRTRRTAKKSAPTPPKHKAGTPGRDKRGKQVQQRRANGHQEF
ncbi:hypothetical protein Tcan_01977 [Toxocara canis]|uniref:Uncharacterized protein n=1 Tax=Toxocara canis TaxID=6265 RepID=A0A0B2UTU2_TOXCA|nr:hypothetical protein Tcan_01977 [Toxocara canis]